MCAVFVIDAGGHVVACNASARQLWAAGKRPIVTLPLVVLLGEAQDPIEPDVLLEQWKALKIEALDRWTRRMAMPFSGPAVEVNVRLERATGGAGSYIALIRPMRRAMA